MLAQWIAHLHILHRIRRRGPPGVAGADSVGVRGNFANMSVSGRVPSPSTVSQSGVNRTEKSATHSSLPPPSFPCRTFSSICREGRSCRMPGERSQAVRGIPDWGCLTVCEYKRMQEGEDHALDIWPGFSDELQCSFWVQTTSVH